jgi:hypothetical protein
MSELQDKLDRGEITPEEYHAQWNEQMAEYPCFHDRLFEYLMARYPGSGMDADAFFDSE